MDTRLSAYQDQYYVETTWSNRAADDLVNKAIQGQISLPMEFAILELIQQHNPGEIEDVALFTKLFSLLLQNREARPIQAIATPFGQMAGFKNPSEAFQWGVAFFKAARHLGLYTLAEFDGDWYVRPAFKLDKHTLREIDRLHYLPPMQVVPNSWENNHGGGWVWETKHLVLGNQYTKHNRPLAYDVINKLQEIPWTIDPVTYMKEKNTNRVLNKQKFLRVVSECLGKPFYFVWRYDSRGRSYSSGYDLNLQSNEYGKGLLSLYNKEEITRTDNLFVAIANHAGKDKLTWAERIAWVEGQDPDEIEWDEPILGRKAIRAYNDAVEGKPSGYVMSLDATSSGLQIMSILSGCKKTGKLVNATDPTKRYDLYGEVTEMVNDDVSRPVSRKIMKQCVMTRYYNSEATPKALLRNEQLESFYNALNGLLPGAEEVMDAINTCWNPNADHHSWEMPDGHNVYVPVVEGVNIAFQDSELGELPFRYYAQKPSDNFRSLCPNVIHSIDGYVAREMVRRCNFQLSHIHDCFVFSPDHLQDVADTYREIMAEIAASDLLQDIMQQITGDYSIKIQKYSDDMPELILQSEYMLS